MNATAPIPALETVWRGYRFRSRCEARWAVFFDALGIPFEYEKEGFDLPSGRYLPDFWLPREKVWAEVKGQEVTKHESQLCVELAHITGCACATLVGPPSLSAIVADCVEFNEHGDGCIFYLLMGLGGGVYKMREWQKGVSVKCDYDFKSQQNAAEISRVREAVYASRAERFGT